MSLPGDAPVRFDALDCGVFYVLEGEALHDLSVVYTDANLHGTDAGDRGGRVAHNLRHSPSVGEYGKHLQHLNTYEHLYQCHPMFSTSFSSQHCPSQNLGQSNISTPLCPPTTPSLPNTRNTA